MKRTVLIGGSRAQKLPALVCEYSIRCRAHEQINILHSWDRPAPEPKKKENRSRTGFSFVRFTLPARADYEGVGIYLDSDMILCERIEPLFNLLSPGRPLMCTSNLPAVILLDCKAVDWEVDGILSLLDDGTHTYQDTMDLSHFFPSRTIPNHWNSLDELKSDTKLIHYTDMSRQPWRVMDKRPVCEMWWNELGRAMFDGFISRDILREEVEVGHVIKAALQRFSPAIY